MKGTIKLYFDAPNTAKVRTRIEKPSESFTQNLRKAIQETAAEVLNEQTLAIRAKMIKKFSEMGENVKDAKAAAALASVLNPYFDVVVSVSKEALPSSDEEVADEAPETTEKDSDEFED